MANLKITWLLIGVVLLKIGASQSDNREVEKEKVFDCFIYGGEDEAMFLKLHQTSDYVDYFIVTELERFSEGRSLGFAFNTMNFEEYSQKIIYMPARNLPHRRDNLTPSEKQKNKQTAEDFYLEALKILAHPNDTIILGHINSLISEDALKAFKSENHGYACTKMQSFFIQSSNGQPVLAQLPQDQQTRLLTFHHFEYAFAGQSSTALADQLCKKQTMTLQGAGFFINSSSNKQKSAKQSENKVRFPDKLNQAVVFLSINKFEQRQTSASDPLYKDTKTYYPIQTQTRFIKSAFVFGFLIPVLFLAFHHFYNGQKTDLLNSKNFVSRDFLTAIVISFLCLLFIFVKANTPGSAQQNQINARRWVFACFPYNGQEHLLKLKLQITNSFVDYYILTEGQYSHTGIEKELLFNYSKFEKYAHRILYIPLRNMPLTHSQNATFQQKWDNQRFMRDSAQTFLRFIARPKDIIISDDCDQMISREAFSKFNPQIHGYVSTQMRLFYYYFNTRSVYDLPQRQAVYNYWYAGTKIITYHVLNSKIEGSLAYLRRRGCEKYTSSQFLMLGDLSCPGEDIIPMAGWHFSYIMDDERLLRKMRSYADSPDTNLTISDFKEQRSRGTATNAYNKHLPFLDADLPPQLVEDILVNGKNSIYAPYFHQLDIQKLGKLQQNPKRISQIDNKSRKVITSNQTETQNTKIEIVSYSFFEILYLKFDLFKQHANMYITGLILSLVIFAVLIHNRHFLFQRRTGPMSLHDEEAERTFQQGQGV